MTTEEKLQALKAINTEIEKMEKIVSRLSYGPCTIEVTQGLIPGVVATCVARKSALMLDAQKLMQ